MSTLGRRIDPLHEAACLAHTIPGVALRLWCDGDHELLVSSACLGAQLDPCQLRAGLLAPRVAAVPHLADLIVGVEPITGLLHLGGGLYERTSPDRSGRAVAERWFVTSLGHEQLEAALATCDVVAPADAFAVVLKPDFDLGVCAVNVRCTSVAAVPHLDEVAMWALSTCLVDELLAETSRQPHDS